MCRFWMLDIFSTQTDQLFISVLRVHGDVVCVGDLLLNVNRSV